MIEPLLDYFSTPEEKWLRALYVRAGGKTGGRGDGTRESPRTGVTSSEGFCLSYALEAEVSPPNPGWQCKECQYRSQCWAWS